MKKSLMALFSFLTLFSCSNAPKEEPSSFVPKLTDAEISAGILTPEVMLKMKRVSGANLSPDKTKVLYSINVQDVENNKGYTNLFVTNLADNSTIQLTNANASHYNAMWVSADKINFLSSRDGSLKLWTVNADGSNLAPIAEIDPEIAALSISPKGDKVWFTKQVKVEQTKEDMYPDMPKSNTKIYDDLMVRHWDYWLDGSYSHLFVADFDGKNITNAVDITEGEASDVPMAPYFSTSDIAWGNTGEKIAYSAKKLSGKEYALSTDSDIYIYDLKTGKTINVTEGAVGYDRNPVFSNDDTLLAYTSMERFSNESDKERLMVLDMAAGTKTYLTADFDYNASDMNWSDDNSTIYFIAPMQARYQICSANYSANETSDVKVLTSGTQDYTSLILGSDEFIVTKTTLDRPTDIFKVNLEGTETTVTDANKEIYDVIKLGKVEERMVKTTDGKDMLTWVVYPPDFDPTKKYPTLLYCQGGPQSVVSQRWSYRWNLQVFASQGYIIVAPNRRGLPSFGQEWLDQISGDYSGQNIKDYLSAIDDVAKESYVDNDRLGCVGASYGGYSAYFLAGNHQKRFKAFISHCGMFNFESFYGSTEELWFPNNDLKGTYWSEDPVAKRSYANSPHKFVKNWDSPILILVGLKDYRIPYTESLQAHTAAQLMGVPSRLVVFEDEGHQVFKPQNALVWHSEFFNFLDKYLKK